MSDDDTIRAAVQRLAFTQMSMFVAESNRIEGIERHPTRAEVEASLKFFALPGPIRIDDLEDFVRAVQPGAKLRQQPGMDVIVAMHTPPPGGPYIIKRLNVLLDSINEGRLSTYSAHVEYEWLHPFMDGNGRSGRILWAWQMRNQGHQAFAMPFLHRWYYQSLDGARAT